MSLTMIANKVCKITGTSIRNICGPSSKHHLSEARALFSIICAEQGVTHLRIAHFLNRSESAITTLIKRYKGYAEYDKNLTVNYNKIREAVDAISERKAG